MSTWIGTAKAIERLCEEAAFSSCITTTSQILLLWKPRMRYIVLSTLLFAICVGCGSEGNQVLTPQPKPQKTDEELTAEMMQGTLDVDAEMKAQSSK